MDRQLWLNCYDLRRGATKLETLGFTIYYKILLFHQYSLNTSTNFFAFLKI